MRIEGAVPCVIASLIVVSMPLAGPRATAPQSALRISGSSSYEMEFVPIPPGEFQMGCVNENEYCSSDERPAHRVKISRGFELGKYEVTQIQWSTLMKTKPSHVDADMNPVDMVSWDDVQQFLKKLNVQKKDGYRYRLPTEAEWEYAARAGTGDDYLAHLDDIAWTDRNAGATSHPAGRKEPNAWGLYDMFGNAFEWVQDWYGDNYYTGDIATDPTGPVKGERRVLRGGSWLFPAQYARASIRFFNLPTLRYKDLGFRVLRQRLPYGN